MSDLVSGGGCDCGCNDARTVETDPVVWAGRRLRVNANPDGLWPRRKSEIAEQLQRLDRSLRAVSAGGRGRAVDALAGWEAFVVGVEAAVWWSMGGGDPGRIALGLPLCDASVVEVMYANRGYRGVWADWDRGVVAWLRWLTGQEEEIPYPAPGSDG